MRKFLAWTFILTTAVALTFVVANLIGAMEVITVSASGDELVELGDNIVYTEVGENFSIEINQSNKNPNTEVVVSSDDESIIKANEDGSFTAVGGGHTVVRVTTTNIYFRNLIIEVFVGDGASTSPYYIFNGEQFASIGRPSEKYSNYNLYDSYKMIADIDVSSVNEGLWKPLDAFSGYFDGNGYTIKGININKNQYVNKFGIEHEESFINNGLFAKIEAGGAVFNTKIANFTASSIYESGTTTMGTVAGINNGKVERVEVTDAKITTNATYIGGVVGINESIEKFTPTYNLHNARVDQASASISFGSAATHGVTGIIGGLVGKNAGGTVIYSYSVGDVYITNNATFGGLIGENIFINTATDIEQSKLKDSYSANKLYIYFVNDINSLTVGGVIGINSDKSVDGEENAYANIIMGSYYNLNNLNTPESTMQNKEFTAIGKDIVNGDTIQRVEQIGFVYPYTSAQLKVKGSYTSHEKKEIIINSSSVVIRESTIVIKWNFDNIWKLDATVNNGYPTLRYLALNNIDQLDYTEYDDFNKVIELHLDAYIVTLGQVLGGNQTTDIVNIKVYNESDNLIASTNESYNLPVLSDAVIMNYGQNLMVYRNGVKVYKITAQPVDVGYNIVGWANANGETNWSDAIECKQDIYLNAVAEKIKIITSAIFVYNGATGPIGLPAKQDYTYGEKYGLLPSPIKLGSWFEGWYLEPNFVTKVDEFSTVINSEKTHKLYAKWGTLAHTHYSIVYNANGGSGYYTDNVLMGESYTLLSHTSAGITRGGFTFIGWAVTASGDAIYSAGETITPTANISLYAVWEAKTSPHTAVALRHNKSATSGAIFNTTIIGSNATFTISLNNGYKFIGWYSNPHYTEQQDLVSTSSSYTIALSTSVILYAYWLEDKFQTCNICGTNYDGARCPNEKYCSHHRTYYHGACIGTVSCTACGTKYQCGTSCPRGPINYCPQHGDYHGYTCPYTHSTNCAVCGTKYYGDRCPSEKYCPEHRVYYHGSCNKNTYCNICKAYYRCGVDCSRNHRRCYTCNTVYSSSQCPNEKYCYTHNIYYHGNKCPISHTSIRIRIDFYFKNRYYY